MVKAHKKDCRKIQRDVEKQKKAAEMAMNEDSMQELRVRVRDTSSGKILKGENAPLASELEAWLEKVCLLKREMQLRLRGHTLITLAHRVT